MADTNSKMTSENLIAEINSMLEDMDIEQLENCYDFVCNEYDEKNHEGNTASELVKLAKKSAILGCYNAHKCKLLTEEEMEQLRNDENVPFF